MKAYRQQLILIGSVLLGGLLGFLLKDKAIYLKPLGDLFLNLLFVTLVPLVFFSIASSVASMSNLRRLGHIMSHMLAIFIITGAIASIVMILGVLIFDPVNGIQISLGQNITAQQTNVGEWIVRAFTANDFIEILSKKNMLALIIFAILVGLASSLAKEEASAFIKLLESGTNVMLKLVDIIMLIAPLGLGAYFAYLIGVFGPDLLGAYAKSMAVYYPISFLYFILAFTFYAWLAGGSTAIRNFWKNIIPPTLTALGTCSSMATIPSNLEAAQKSGVPRDIREVVIPIGATIHMEGSCLAAILKIAILFGIFGRDFSSPETLAIAVGVSILAGTVVSGIPGGGVIGEILILTLYGFPMEALPIITVIGTLVDPPATLINAIGDNVSSMLIARFIDGKNWAQSKNVT